MKVPVAMSERHDPLGGAVGVDRSARRTWCRGSAFSASMSTSGSRRCCRCSGCDRVCVVASTVAGAIDSRDGGLAAGDVVYAVNRTPVAGLAELRAALDAAKPGDAVVLQLERRGELMYLAFTVD